MKEILRKCSCRCHSSNGVAVRKRPMMEELHRHVQNRNWDIIKSAIRNDVSVTMRIDDSDEEDKWFYMARDIVWRRDISLLNEVVSHGDMNYLNDNLHDNQGQSTKQSNTPEVEEAPIPRYWVSNQRHISAIRQKRTLLHMICKLVFDSDEAPLAQLSNQDCNQLDDLVEADLTVKMIIDASVNQLRPIEEGHYNESLEDGVLEAVLDKTCKECSCYYQCNYCPPFGLHSVEKYVETADICESPSTKENTKILHHSALTMVDRLGATPLHLLTGEGSAHVDLVRVLLDGCCPCNEGVSGNDSRPLVYDLIAAQNGHGCTALHFLSDNASEKVLCLVLERLHQEYESKASTEQCIDELAKPHPLLIQDNEGDTALHFACSNGASDMLLRILTTFPGQPQSVYIKNAYGRLPIDDLINFWIDSDGDEMSESSEDIDNEMDCDSNARIDEECLDCNPDDLISHVLRIVFDRLSANSLLSLSFYDKFHLWDRMWVLVQTGVRYLTESNCRFHRILAEQFHSVESEFYPIHAAVIVTKYLDYPAIALVGCMFIARQRLIETNPENERSFDTQKHLLRKDSVGLIPLHWACGSIDNLMASNTESFDCHAASTSTYDKRVCWNSKILRCSMIEFLLRLCPESARVPTREGRLPLHLYLDGGYDRQQDLRYTWADVEWLLGGCPEAIRIPDPCSQLYPFQIVAAASSDTSDPETVEVLLKSIELTYRLIMEDPSLCFKAC